MSRALRVVAVVVALASAAAGASFGAFAGAVYERGGRGGPVITELRREHPNAGPEGLVAGAALGLAVGIGWARWMRRAPRRSGWLALAGRGLLGGVLAGLASTMFLHLGLQLAYGTMDGAVKLVGGLVVSLFPGGLLGLIGGVLWAVCARRAEAEGAPGAEDAGAPQA